MTQDPSILGTGEPGRYNRQVSSEEQAPVTTTEAPKPEDTAMAELKGPEAETPVAKVSPDPKTVKEKVVSKPVEVPQWWKNTYFWLGGILLIVGILGLVGGPGIIRDPGQKREDSVVVMLYFIGAVVMVVNGWLSHRQTVREFEEERNHG